MKAPHCLDRNQRRDSLTFRIKLFVASITGLILLAVIVLVIIPAPEPPITLLERARSAIDEAAEAGALCNAEITYRTAQDLLRAGWMEMGHQNGRLALFRNYHASDSLLSLAHQTACRAAEESRERISSLDSLAQCKYSELEKEIAAWHQALNGSLVKLKAEAYLSSASLSLETGRLLIDQGEYEEALQSFTTGQDFLWRLSDMIAEYSNDEAQKINVWRDWVEETLAESRKKGTYVVIVDKSAHKTYMVRSGKLVHTYDCDLGYNSSHNKLFAGDGATPEGKYRVVSVKSSGSKYYKALMLNYPNQSDKNRFEVNKKKGLISPHASIGGFIEIHGKGGKDQDWTEGCVALTNGDMDHLMKYVTKGTLVTIVRRSDRWP